ncbi:hypothetical protein COC42_10750 [Sphingomonas spermidinifaciens]|uniref:Uncharacterized protein n=1 Tax=Sphingomonas spermidinifaciens TaxID=1141889 RepID=A0A2A4B2F8_9SPHN|nr:phage tail protein [Sphingomonas spermidinifaciens]PCD01969.1 hypothetical protein COC42_10750 [Sphingomonas spermidinifaciens]
MATLILTTVGTIVGGPIGGAIGAIAGQAVDRAVFRPAARQGPRLNELAVQTSSYGSEIPQLFGTMRVAGTVIWATDLIETQSTDGGGKGAPHTVRYSYSASFAVLLSARPIRTVRRIWADGKLLRGVGGGFTAETGFRLHTGGEDQAADPLIASAVGAERAMAMRGQAYAVFEGLALADFANRIPSLTFEVVADEGACDPGEIAAAVGGGRLITREPMGPALGGFSAHGGSRRAVIEALANASGGWFAPDGDAMAMRAGEGPAVAVADAGLGGARGVRTVAPADQAPKVVTIGHYDAARDYQAGLQRAVRPGAGWRERHEELPAVLAADTAKQVAASMLARADADRRRRRVACGWEGLAIPPGARVRVEGDAGLWRVTGWSLEAMAVELELAPIALATATASADPGAVVGAPDRPRGRTILVAAELPPLDDALPSRAQIVVVAGGTEPGWRGATVLMSSDAGTSWSAAASLRAAGVVGQVVTPPGTGLAAIEDRRSELIVELAHDGMTLAGASQAGMDGGGNLALVGGELIQFGVAEQVAPRRWRLRQLWRGRRGTGLAIGGHVAGEPFALLSPGSVTLLPAGVAIGGTLSLAPSSPGDTGPLRTTEVPVTGVSVAPPAPAHLRAARVASGGCRLDWIRRSRAGWRWEDAVDVPLVEERERYRIEILGGAGPPRFVESDAATLSIDGGGNTARLVQIGTHGASPARTIMLED